MAAALIARSGSVGICPALMTRAGPSGRLSRGSARPASAGFARRSVSTSLQTSTSRCASSSRTKTGRIASRHAFTSSTTLIRQLYVNGWQFGRRVANLGPQTVFPVPPVRCLPARPELTSQGILDHRGSKCAASLATDLTSRSTVVLALWALEDSGAQISSLRLELGHVVRGGVGAVSMRAPTWSDLRS